MDINKEGAAASPSLLSIKMLHGHPYLLIPIKRALLDGHYQPGPEILYQQNARRAKLPDHREHPVFPFKTFAADLLISIHELLISINVVSAYQ